MKKVVIGGFFALIGTIWALTVLLFVRDGLVSAWATPPGRFFTTVLETGMLLPFVLATALLAAGLAVLTVEYFRKER